MLPEFQPFHKWVFVATVATSLEAQADSLLPFTKVPDKEYDAHYEAIVQAIKSVTEPGFAASHSENLRNAYSHTLNFFIIRRYTI